MQGETKIDEAGLRAAEAVAQWHLGDRGWARILIGAYLNPEAALANLKAEKESYDGASR